MIRTLWLKAGYLSTDFNFAFYMVYGVLSKKQQTGEI